MWQLLKKENIKCTSRKCNKAIRTYANGRILSVFGEFECTVEIEGMKQNVIFLVIKEKAIPILGKASAKALEVLKVGIEARHRKQEVDYFDSHLAEQLQHDAPSTLKEEAAHNQEVIQHSDSSEISGAPQLEIVDETVETAAAMVIKVFDVFFTSLGKCNSSQIDNACSFLPAWKFELQKYLYMHVSTPQMSTEEEVCDRNKYQEIQETGTKIDTVHLDNAQTNTGNILETVEEGNRATVRSQDGSAYSRDIGQLEKLKDFEIVGDESDAKPAAERFNWHSKYGSTNLVNINPFEEKKKC
jgi:hypothetical protein